MNLIFIVGLWLLLEWYAFQAIKTLVNNRWVLVAYGIISLGLMLYILYTLSTFDRATRSAHDVHGFMLALGLLVLTFVPKIILGSVLFLEDIYRVSDWIIRFFFSDSKNYIQGRRKFISVMALGLASVPFLSIAYGIWRGRYDYRVIRKQVFFKNLPPAFDGFKVLQISDIHSGSFDNANKVAYGIDLIQEQKADVILFTGDMVNSVSAEMRPWKELFSKLSAPFGMFSVLGNHDYATYGNYSKEEQKESIEELIQIQAEIGFKNLRNENVTLEKNGETIHILGVENWGNSSYFPKKGDLKKATTGLSNDDFKILMSHDPSHFDHDLEEHDNIRDFPNPIHLTLSGHTHGMQFGIEIPGFLKWSPVKYRYPKWAGLYEEKDRKLYVNRGFGYLAFPGRVGIWPEITVLELKKG